MARRSRLLTAHITPDRPSVRAYRTKSGAGSIKLLPLRRGGWKGSQSIPLGWRNIVPRLAENAPFTERRLNTWLLVLAAKRIPHRFFSGRAPRIYLPALYENTALQEIRLVENEKRRIFPIYPPEPSYACGWIICAVLLLWHGLRWNFFASLGVPAPLLPVAAADWPLRFGLTAQTISSAEWWRAGTALMLHADGAHLAGNCLFGLIFYNLLAGQSGWGTALLLMTASGMAGNWWTAALRDTDIVSIGFSTSVFGTVGALAAFSSITRQQAGRGFFRGAFVVKVLLPLAGALAVLAMLGTGGERTDYRAHISGLLCGLILGLPCAYLYKRLRNASPAVKRNIQITAACISIGLYCISWQQGIAALYTPQP